MRFSIYEHNLIYYKGMLLTRYFIVLKDDKKQVLCWTDFHKYIKGQRNRKIKHLQSSNKNQFQLVAKFLNYCFFEQYSISSLFEITPEMLKNFMNLYCLENIKNSQYSKTEATMKKTLSYLMDFLIELSKTNLTNYTEKDLYTEKNIYSRKLHKLVTTKIPIFTIYCSNEAKKPVFRDMPISCFQIILSTVIEKHTDILMIVAAQAFAGLRGSEACNIRDTGSILGTNLFFEKIDGEIRKISIDLTLELNLRNDLKPVGKIKKERIAYVYDDFIQAFCDCYEIYKKRIAGRKRDSKYCPLSFDNNGNAMTFDSYRKRFKNAVTDSIEKMIKSDNQEVVNYAHILMENNISPHIFRHFFSMMLVYYGVDIATLQFYRGDSSPESSIVYIQNKSEINKKLRFVKNKIFELELDEAKKRYGND